MVALGYSMAAALVCALVTAAVERWARGMDDNLVLAPAATLCAALFP